jgi:GAF domain-containing protein
MTRAHCVIATPIPHASTTYSEKFPGPVETEDHSIAIAGPLFAGHGAPGHAVSDLSLARDEQTIREIVRSTARQLTGADGATLVMREGDLCYYVEEDPIGPLWKGKRFPMSACISGWAMLNRTSVVVEDIYHDPRIPAAAYLPTFVKSLVMVPIRPAHPIGAICNYWATRHQAEPHEVKLLQALADNTSIALEHVRAPPGTGSPRARANGTT